MISLLIKYYSKFAAQYILQIKHFSREPFIKKRSELKFESTLNGSTSSTSTLFLLIIVFWLEKIWGSETER